MRMSRSGPHNSQPQSPSLPHQPYSSQSPSSLSWHRPQQQRARVQQPPPIGQAPQPPMLVQQQQLPQQPPLQPWPQQPSTGQASQTQLRVQPQQYDARGQEEYRPRVPETYHEWEETGRLTPPARPPTPSERLPFPAPDWRTVVAEAVAAGVQARTSPTRTVHDTESEGLWERPPCREPSQPTWQTRLSLCNKHPYTRPCPCRCTSRSPHRHLGSQTPRGDTPRPSQYSKVRGCRRSLYRSVTTVLAKATSARTAPCRSSCRGGASRDLVKFMQFKALINVPQHQSL